MTATIHADNRVNLWMDKDFREWERGDPFAHLRGTGDGAPIHVGRSREGKKTGGQMVTRSLSNRWNIDPVLNDNMLRGAETSTTNLAHTVTLTQYRMADIVGTYERKRAAFDIVESIKAMASMWGAALRRDLTIDRLAGIDTAGVLSYDALTDAQRNAWAVAQNPLANLTNQRALYGTTQANYSGVHATDLANIDNTADEAHQEIVRHIRRMVQSADPHIRPAMSSKKGDAGSERFHIPMGSRAFRDLCANMEQVFRDADTRGDSNRIFAGGRIMVENVECFEVPEMDRTVGANHGALVENVGAGGTVDVQVLRCLGGQALILELGEEMHDIEEKDDYGNLLGYGVAQTFAIENATFGSVDRGMGTAFVAAEPD